MDDSFLVNNKLTDIDITTVVNKTCVCTLANITNKLFSICIKKEMQKVFPTGAQNNPAVIKENWPISVISTATTVSYSNIMH